MATIPQSTFLGLPLEIRQIIYNLCYCDPLSASTHEWITVPESASAHVPKRKPKRRRLHKRDNGTEKQLRRIVTKCLFPKCHLSLASVSRQVRNEYFPILAAHHTFSFSDPLVFANEYLSYTPPHRYSNIRHLALTWNPSNQTCGCEVEVGECRTHISRARDVNRDMRNFISLVSVYPELFSNVESIRFDLHPLHSDSTSGNRIELFRNAVLLVEKMNYSSETTAAKNRKYLIVPHSKSGSYASPVQLNIFAIPHDLWMQSVDGATLLTRRCDACTAWDFIFSPMNSWECEKHNIDWSKIDQFVSALQERRLYPHKESSPSEGENVDADLSNEKNWKVLFDTNNAPRTAWEAAMTDLNAWKGTDRKSKQEGRKRKTTG
jgi:hypothetical protein